MTSIKDALVEANNAIINGFLSTGLMLIKGALEKHKNAITIGLLSIR